MDAAGGRITYSRRRVNRFRRSEGEACAYLHDAWRSLNFGEIGPIRWRLKVVQSGIRIDGKITVIGVSARKMLSVGHVEHFPTERQLLFLAPRHVKDLADPHVQGDIARCAKYV